MTQGCFIVKIYAANPKKCIFLLQCLRHGAINSVLQADYGEGPLRPGDQSSTPLPIWMPGGPVQKQEKVKCFRETSTSLKVLMG